MPLWLTTILGRDYLQLLLLLGGLSLLLLAWRMQDKDVFDFRDLIRENGRISLSKFAQFGAFCVSTWVFVHLTVKGNLTEWYYSTYMLSWAGANLVNAWINTKSAKDSAYGVMSSYRSEPQYSRMGAYWRDQAPPPYGVSRESTDAEGPVVGDVQDRL